MKLSVAIRSCLFLGALALIAGAPGCGGGDSGGPGGSGVAGNGEAGNGEAGTSGQAGTSGEAGTSGNAGQGGDTGGAGAGGSTSGGGGRGGNGMGNGGRGGSTGTGGRGGGTGTAGRGGATGTAGRGGATGAGGRGGATGAGGTGGAATFAQVATILGTSCGTGTCHDGTQHVDLRNTTGLYGRIVNASPNGSRTMASCTSRMLIVPNNVANSVIAQVIMASVSGCTNARMPDECPSMRQCLTAAQISTITNWITAGAPM